MADHRVTDICYGHVGEGSYDLDEQNWTFTREVTLESSIQPLNPLEQCVAPSIQVTPELTTLPSQSNYAQTRWLAKTLPEAGSAKTLISFIQRTESATQNSASSSSLLAIGRASDIDHTSGSRDVQIVAMAHGQAGNILRLIKPRVEALGWDGRHGTKLRSLNPASSEECFWAEDGGSIQHITFAADGDGQSSWLAVLKAEFTTILRPIYRRVQAPSPLIAHSSIRYPASRLSANPILTLKNEKTGARPHVDVSFNPWYIRQFAIFDQQGYWTVWDIEGQKRRRATFEAKPGKSGHIHDDLISDQSFKIYGSADGWGRIMWAGSVSTLVVCDRRSLAVFDLKSAPKRLYSPELVHPNSTDWILDVKRNPNNLHQIFVLTSNQVFWLQINAAGEDRDELYGYVGARILLSCRHFRNGEDDTAKFELFGEKDDCVAFVYSARSSLVNTYRFSMTLGGSTTPVITQSSFVMSESPDNKNGAPSSMIQTLCLLPTTFMLHNLHPMSGFAREYANRDIRFYQLFSLSPTLGLSHTLCSTRRVDVERSSTKQSRYEKVVAPTSKTAPVTKFTSLARVVDDDFIVPDGLEEVEDEETPLDVPLSALSLSRPSSLKRRRSQDYISMSVDGRVLFGVSFLQGEHGMSEEDSSPQVSRTVNEYLENIHLGIQDRNDHGAQGLTPLFDLAGYTSFSEDVDEAASTVRELERILGQNEDDGSSMSFRLATLNPLPFIGHDSESSLDLSNLYDKLIDHWVTCLPRHTPGPARLARERIIRTIAMGLHMSSLAVSTRDKSVPLPEPAQFKQKAKFVLPVRGKPASIGQGTYYGTQSLSEVPASSLPIPATTPTHTANDDPIELEEPSEDSAISRLRGHTVSVTSLKPLSTSRSIIMAHWPSSPGVDPKEYSYEAVRGAITEDEDSDSDEEESYRRKKDEERKRRRTERFLKRQRANTMDAASQPAPMLAFGSQPEMAQHAFSSQTVDIPMTQPEGGVFGSRPGPKGFKKRRKGGF